MPTITVISSPIPPHRRRALALGMTQWLRRRDTNPTHVIVRFQHLDPGSTFSAGRPIEGSGGVDVPVFIECSVGSDRDELFVAEFAQVLARLVDEHIEDAWVHVQFTRTSRNNVYTGLAFDLKSADPAPHDAARHEEGRS